MSKAEEIKPVTPRTKDLQGELLDWFNYAEALRQENNELRDALDGAKGIIEVNTERREELQSKVEELKKYLRIHHKIRLNIDESYHTRNSLRMKTESLLTKTQDQE